MPFRFTLSISIPELQEISKRMWIDHDSLPDDKPGEERTPISVLKLHIMNVAQTIDCLITLLEKMKTRGEDNV